MRSVQNPPAFHRTPSTWQAYLSIGYFSYMLNVLGPLTPFLRDELRITYTVASFHFTAYAAGTILTGLVLSRIILRWGAYRVMWSGAVGVALGILLVMFGGHAAVTIGGGLVIGLAGVVIVAIFQGALAAEHGAQRAIALTESTVFASLFGTLAPLTVGYFSRTPLTWRGALALGPLMLVVLWVVFHKKKDLVKEAAGADDLPGAAQASPAPRLPLLYWAYWVAALLAVSIEFCIIAWGADYLQKAAGLLPADAALGMSLFMGAMLVGRLANSRLVWGIAAQRLVQVSAGLASLGFALFWLAPWLLAGQISSLLAMVGLALAGMGVAGMFPMFASLALGTCPERLVEGASRFTLSSGIAILALPLLLGGLADAFGIRVGYGLVAVLLALTTLVVIRTSVRRAVEEE